MLSVKYFEQRLRLTRERSPATNTTADQVHKLVSRFVIKVHRECIPNWCDDNVIVHADIADSRTPQLLSYLLIAFTPQKL